MPRGDKSSYTNKQKRQADHIREGYERRGITHDEAEARAWATVNKMTHGGRRSGAGRGSTTDRTPARAGGRSAAQRNAAARSASARKATRTRKNS